MLNPNDSIFKYEDWLDNNEGEPSYNYYVETTKKRKEILSAMGTPYFEEIKQRTKGIQDKLKKEGYEDIDLQLRSLFLDGIKFFLNLDTDEPQLDNKKWLYLKGLFDSLMINTENKKLLNNILSELKKGGEKLPESPIDFLIDNGQNRTGRMQKPNKTQKRISDIIGSSTIFEDYSGDDSYKKPNKTPKSRRDIINNLEANIRNIYSRMENLRSRDGRLKGKEIMKGHCAYNDSSHGLKLYGEDVVIYQSGDNYIPSDNHGISLNLLNKVNNASVTELEEMYKKDSRIHDLDWKKRFYKDDKEGYIKSLKGTLLFEITDFIGMYDKGERFEVVKGTYNDKEIDSIRGEDMSCWYVQIRSQKTGKIYRVLSI